MAPADAEIQQIVQRIIKLSEKPDNPGMAYRHLEMIQTLGNKLSLKLFQQFSDDASAEAAEPDAPPAENSTKASKKS